MASALRSSVGLALRHAAAPSRVSSAGRNAPANTCCRRTMHSDYGGGPGDKGDAFFAVCAAVGTCLFCALMDGDLYLGWGKETTASRQPRMSSRRRR